MCHHDMLLLHCVSQGGPMHVSYVQAMLLHLSVVSWVGGLHFTGLGCVVLWSRLRVVRIAIE